ncbi:hypothetical protein THAOC_04669, partial [Thalassiosira oceanica]
MCRQPLLLSEPHLARQFQLVVKLFQPDSQRSSRPRPAVSSRYRSAGLIGNLGKCVGGWGGLSLVRLVVSPDLPDTLQDTYHAYSLTITLPIFLSLTSSSYIAHATRPPPLRSLLRPRAPPDPHFGRRDNSLRSSKSPKLHLRLLLQVSQAPYGYLHHLCSASPFLRVSPSPADSEDVREVKYLVEQCGASVVLRDAAGGAHPKLRRQQPGREGLPVAEAAAAGDVCEA